jgi:hypothetical protein
MLSNVLSLSEKVSKSIDAIKYHVYSRPWENYLKDKTKHTNTVNIRVHKNGSVSFITPFENENILKNSYTLRYRNCDNDTKSVPVYFLGDFDVRYISKTGSYAFKFSDHIKESEKFDLTTLPEVATEIRKILFNNLNSIDDFLLQNTKDIITLVESEDVKRYAEYHTYVSVDISEFGYTQWYEIESLLSITDNIHLNKLGADLFEVSSVEGKEVYSLNKSLINQLTSGDVKNDNQFPDFDDTKKYRSHYLKDSERPYFYYYSGVVQACRLSIPWASPLTLRVIPVGDISFKDFTIFVNYLKESNSYKKLESKKDASESLAEESIKPSVDPLLSFEVEGVSSIVYFDLIFVREEKAHINILEVNNVDRSYLRKLKTRIQGVSQDIVSKYKGYPPQVVYSLKNLLGSITPEELFKGHLLKILPKIYMGVYYQDPYLFRSYVDSLCHSIREGGFSSGYYYSLKKSYEFLDGILLKKKGGVSMSSSRELGKLVASVVWPLGKVISSFEKHQLGYLTSRVTSTREVNKFLIGGHQRVLLHKGELAGNKEIIGDDYSMKKAQEIIVSMTSNSEVFDRYEFAAGFFDQYSYKIYSSEK